MIASRRVDLVLALAGTRARPFGAVSANVDPTPRRPAVTTKAAPRPGESRDATAVVCRVATLAGPLIALRSLGPPRFRPPIRGTWWTASRQKPDSDSARTSAEPS
jgi:hypothetical protein